jgi:hypothetical protein
VERTIYVTEGDFRMKLTRKRLKQIVSEELGRIREVDNSRVHIATAQSMMDDLNQTSDPKLTDEICALLDQIVTTASNLTDPTMKAAIIAHVESFKTIVGEVQEDELEREKVDMPDQNMGGVEVDAPKQGV